ncbi:MAG: UDP-N-acetylmuramoyl-tripeptide--D-alanyl-D-alanine ligase [Actinomycetota bacterium]|nr:UDP-N-acetylmuramoyl-tripeptide--D-alanyl-D-alanine ligase [Actinomycetota bacterium]
MIPLEAARIAEVVDGRLAGAAAGTVVSGVCFDSRAVIPGSLFVAIEGARSNGHDYVAPALAAGATLALVSRPLEDASGAPLPCLVVADPVVALGTLAGWVRRELLSCTVVAITGSSGKTSTKDLLGTVLDQSGPTVRAHASFNTEVGLPVTILSADETTRYLVLEMGMRGPGHLAYLCGVARPDAGVVINVGSAHLGVVGSREAIARAKAELVESLPAEGLAVLNADDATVAAMAARTEARVVTFGESEHADVRAVDVQLDDLARPSFTLLHHSDGLSGPVVSAPVSLRLSGEHFVSNALAAAATGLALGMPIELVAKGLEQAAPASKWRMEVSHAPGGFTVVNDAFNANPESMRAALKTLAAMGRGRRTWAVLGEMRELGDDAVSEHDAIGRLAVRLDISRLVCVGEGTRVMHLGASNEGSWGDESVHVANADAAVALLRAEVAPGDVVLVKASRSIGLERVAEALLADSAP